MFGANARLVRALVVTAVSISASFMGLCVNAQEHIISYHSDIDIQADGSMLVTETLRVRAEGVNIQRGIFRDFPTDYRDRLGNQYVVAFDVEGVTRDGNSESWRSERRSNGVRVYIGDEDIFLDTGEYTYLIRYRTNRQIGFFDDHDELYWNVTGNAWAFSILDASATVNLPADIAPEDMSLTAYTGYQGSNSQNYAGSLGVGMAEFSTTQTLAPREGLTIALSWPKGVVAPPSAMRRVTYLLSDNRSLLLMLFAFFGSFIYLYKCWSAVGRDPQAGIIFPHYAPPKGYSPASTRYIMKMGYDKTAFSAAIINLAVKGHLTISKADDEYTLKKSESDTALAAGEEALLAHLFNKGDTLLLDTENLVTLTKAMKAHKAALKKDYKNIYFHLNSWLHIPSLAVSLSILAVVALMDGVTLLIIAMYSLISLMHGLFYYLMRAPSIKGRRLMDKLEGFKQYLEVAEQDDLNLRNPPEKTPELFESYLPFALALGVEQAWAEQFTEVFQTMEATQGQAYHPLWYGGALHSHDIAAFTTDVGSSFSSAIASASTAPGSSSGGGGGGFSGGGGGGGGGGGW